ncbi:MAG: hypothetical protein HN742_37515 [Lentisphaerae bacterium]|nr:hypothetical protein [Lentisphaerota bacterium]MBT7847627.1 hypothetical protein [Lentisphaerota bacterium]
MTLVAFVALALLHVAEGIVSHLHTPKRITAAIEPQAALAREQAVRAPALIPLAREGEEIAQAEHVWGREEEAHGAVARLLQHADPDQAIVLLRRAISGDDQAIDLARALYPRNRKTFIDVVAEEQEKLRQYWAGLSPGDRQGLTSDGTGERGNALEQALRETTRDPLEAPGYLKLLPEELLHCFISNIDAGVAQLPDGGSSLYPLLREELLPVTSLTARIWSSDAPYEVQFDGGYADARDHLNDSFDRAVLAPSLQRFFKSMERRYGTSSDDVQDWFKATLGQPFCRFLTRLPDPLGEPEMRRAWRSVPDQVRVLWSRQLLAEYGVDETCALPPWLPAGNTWFRLSSSPMTDAHYRLIRKHPEWRAALRGLDYPAAARTLTVICHHLGAGSLVQEFRPHLLKPLHSERRFMIGNLIDWGKLRGMLDVEQAIPKALQPSLGSSTGQRGPKPRWHVGRHTTWGSVPASEFRAALRKLADTESDPKRRLRFYELEGLYAENRALD